MDLAEVGLGALAAGYLSAKSNKAGNAGKFMKLPIPLGLALVAGLAAQMGLAGGRSHDLMNIAKGALGAQLAMTGIKLAYAAGETPTVAALPYGAHHFLPRVGATPSVENLFAQAGLSSRAA
jgi:hypothetical protein